MPTDLIFIGSPQQNKLSTSPGRVQGLVDSPVTSAAIPVNAADTLAAVEIGPEVIVHKVMLWCTGASISGADIDVGDGTVADKYIDGADTILKNDIVGSGLAGAVGADPVQGCYYPSGGVINVKINATVDGTVKILVWWSKAS